METGLISNKGLLEEVSCSLLSGNLRLQGGAFEGFGLLHNRGEGFFCLHVGVGGGHVCITIN